jgi:hypothetical protein
LRENVEIALKNNDMEKDFVPYEEALALKGLGFKMECISFCWDDGVIYKGFTKPFNHNKSDYISRPLYQQAFRWFRDNHCFIHRIDKELRGSLPTLYSAFAYNDEHNIRTKQYVSYEKAELACLKKLIEIVKSKQPSK